MLKFGLLLICFTLCQGHAVSPVLLPLPAVHTVYAKPVLASYPLHHGYAAHRLFGHGVIGPIAHHLYKRSAHVAPVGHIAAVDHIAPIAHIASVARVAPVAVSHQERVDVRSSPAFVAAPIVPVVKPVLTSFAPGVGHYGAEHYASVYPHLVHY
ncbi:unnamed protein product [Parnassius apollo]|uniref:(apollo) hypothetical protein n=1 Tax=Parnassius apollo TaxID=110799 RepID=A0A8S3XHL2_PARAO|nr:unnamed protein product [Parnassius apollo]